MEPRHETIAKIALAAGGRYGLALAGGYALQAADGVRARIHTGEVVHDRRQQLLSTNEDNAS